MNPEDGVLSQTKIQQETTTMPVLRHVGDTKFLSLPRVSARDVLAGKSDCAGHVRSWNQSREGFNQFRLAIPFDAGNAHDLAGPDFKRNIVDALRAIAS